LGQTRAPTCCGPGIGVLLAFVGASSTHGDQGRDGDVADVRAFAAKPGQPIGQAGKTQGSEPREGRIVFRRTMQGSARGDAATEGVAASTYARDSRRSFPSGPAVPRTRGVDLLGRPSGWGRHRPGYPGRWRPLGPGQRERSALKPFRASRAEEEASRGGPKPDRQRTPSAIRKWGVPCSRMSGAGGHTEVSLRVDDHPADPCHQGLDHDSPRLARWLSQEARRGKRVQAGRSANSGRQSPRGASFSSAGEGARRTGRATDGEHSRGKPLDEPTADVRKRVAVIAAVQRDEPRPRRLGRGLLPPVLHAILRATSTARSDTSTENEDPRVQPLRARASTGRRARRRIGRRMAHAQERRVRNFSRGPGRRSAGIEAGGDGHARCCTTGR